MKVPLLVEAVHLYVTLSKELYVECLWSQTKSTFMGTRRFSSPDDIECGFVANFVFNLRHCDCRIIGERAFDSAWYEVLWLRSEICGRDLEEVGLQLQLTVFLASDCAVLSECAAVIIRRIYSGKLYGLAS
jgi:hypothetical protein